jgi:hypothetical protein
VETVDQFVARVLHQSHQAALDVGAPDEARTILDVAQSFADELAASRDEFDRFAFVAAVVEDV